MSIHDWPEHERPRERLLQQGAGALANAELLAILLQHGHAGKSAMQLAQDLLEKFEGLQGLCQADYQCFTEQPGVGLAKYAQLHAALELSRRCLSAPILSGKRIDTGIDAAEFVRNELRHHDQEVFAALFLDNKHRILRFERLFFGSLTQATVHPRIIVKRALSMNAAAVIIAHNHPSGDPHPSQSDLDITRSIARALDLVDVRLLDHLLVAGGRVRSFHGDRLQPNHSH